MSFEALALLFAVAVTIHNAEEAVWMPGWSARPRGTRTRVTAREFRFAVAVLTVLAWAVAVLVPFGGKGGVAAYLICGFALAMLINAVVPHVAVTVALRRYAPGTATGLLLNVPVAIGLLRRGFTDDWIVGRTFWWSAPLCVLVLLAALPALFALACRVVAPAS